MKAPRVIRYNAESLRLVLSSASSAPNRFSAHWSTAIVFQKRKVFNFRRTYSRRYFSKQRSKNNLSQLNSCPFYWLLAGSARLYRHVTRKEGNRLTVLQRWISCPIRHDRFLNDSTIRRMTAIDGQSMRWRCRNISTRRVAQMRKSTLDRWKSSGRGARTLTPFRAGAFKAPVSAIPPSRRWIEYSPGGSNVNMTGRAGETVSRRSCACR